MLLNEALNCLDKITGETAQTVDFFGIKGAVLLSLWRSKEAMEYYTQALNIEPENDELLNGKGACLVRLDRYDEAISFFDKAISINPKYTIPKVNKAISLLYFDGDEEAWNIVNELSLKPDSFDLLKFNAVYLLQKEKYKEALAVVNKGISIYSTKNVFMEWKEKCLIGLGRDDEMLDIIDNENTQMQSPDSCYDKAVFLWKKRLFKKAWKFIERALSINPNHQDSLGGKSSLLLVEGKEEEANVIFEKALKAGDDPANVWYGRALAYMELKRHEKALSALKKAIQLDKKIRDAVRKNVEFKPLRNMAEFQRLVGR